MASTHEHEHGIFDVTTNGSGVCRLTPASGTFPCRWYLDGLMLKTSAGGVGEGCSPNGHDPVCWHVRDLDSLYRSLTVWRI